MVRPTVPREIELGISTGSSNLFEPRLDLEALCLDLRAPV